MLLEPPITIAGWCSLLGAPFVSELGQGWAPTWADSQSFWGRRVVRCPITSPFNGSTAKAPNNILHELETEIFVLEVQEWKLEYAPKATGYLCKASIA